ncbi:MAG: hypothetical protein CVU22_14060 [Betaproteobacteria bacterium HGW-Betaproteobacteria-16]|nr:MAG: hypothetical protein CVU22_14060 [Betaproteobacteria bacterium HGW-Betaproteobacteria-16]
MSNAIERQSHCSDDFVVVRRQDLEDLQQKIRILWDSMTTQCCGGSTFQADLSLMQEAGVASSRLAVRPLEAVIRENDADPIGRWVAVAPCTSATTIDVLPG